jgi:Kinetochore complex Sim4 subunit Fta1
MRPTDSDSYPLYGSTYTIYSLSPLYHGSTSLLNNLAIHSRRLREAITGDALRGAQLNAELSGVQSGSAPSGTFRSCFWDLLGDEEVWARAHPDETEDQISAAELTTVDDARGILVEVRYERATHSAILIGNARSKLATPGFTNLPLLLVRMPAALKETFINYLATAFDARISPVKLRPAFTGSAMEKILSGAVVKHNSDFAVDVDAYPKGISLQLGFPSTSPQLKTIQVELKQSDLLEFLRQGQSLWSQRPANSKVQANSAVVGPFTMALQLYLKENLALDLAHPAVVLAKVALGPFALSNEGKVKVMESSLQAQQFWDLLLDEIQRSSLAKT